MSSHHATFTWGPGPQSVFVAGGFNDWSDHATPLQKNADGSFAAEVPLPWGQKQAFKYVVDGEWKVREDEAKEWDAAGNMNNVYTAPPEPVKPESQAAPAAAAAAAVPASTETPAAAPVAEEKKEAEATEPNTLLAASAPSAASAGPVLGAPAVVNTSSTPAVTTTTTTTTTAPAVSANNAPTSTDISAPVAAEPLNAKIEKVAANANIGEATPAGQDEGVLGKVAIAGGAALATLGAVVGTAAVAVERATGVDLTHSQPISIEEAKAKGIDVNSLAKVDAPTDAVSPVGKKPSEAAVADLDEKLKDLKVAAPSTTTTSSSSAAAAGESKQVAVPLPAATAASTTNKPNDIPAQNETKENHSVVPSPVITTLSDKDPKKDRTADSGTAAPATVHTQPVSKSPAVDPKKAKEEAEAREVPREHKSASSATPAAAAVLPAGQAAAAPDQKANNIGSSSSATPSATKPAAPATASAPAAPKPVEKDVFSSSSPSTKTGLPAASAGTTHTTTAPASPSPATVAPASAAAPATPAKSAPTAASVAAPSSVASTPAGTPAKSSHLRDSTTGSGADVKKRKSGFFHKIKTAFSPKDKEKK